MSAANVPMQTSMNLAKKCLMVEVEEAQQMEHEGSPSNQCTDKEAAGAWGPQLQRQKPKTQKDLSSGPYDSL